MSKQRSLVADYAVLPCRSDHRLLHPDASPSGPRARWRPGWPGWLIAWTGGTGRWRATTSSKPSPAATPTPSWTPWSVRLYRHFCTLLMEIINLPRKIHPLNWRRYVRLEDTRLIECLLSGRPLMIVSGHFGNWELGCYVFGLLGFRCHAIARPLDNRFLDDFLRPLPRKQWAESAGEERRFRPVCKRSWPGAVCWPR